MDDPQYRAWKTQLVPILYDWFANVNLTWPTQACRWGAMLDDHKYKTTQRLYYSEQTDGVEPPKLLVANMDVCKPRVASTDAVASWTESSKCPYMKDVKSIVHPGEVNKIRELPQHQQIVVTHTDAPELYVWNTDTQPDAGGRGEKRSAKGAEPASADLVLTGHEEDAQFPLATSSAAPMVASGGTDSLVLLWDLQDAMEGVLAGSATGAAAAAGGSKGPTLAARTRLEGHQDTVEDVVFCPGSATEVVSVGDDKLMLFWDTRQGTKPVRRVDGAHPKQDIHCVDWSALQQHLIATGAADGSFKVWDTRKLTEGKVSKPEPLHSFNQHKAAILRTEWHPSAPNVLASGGEDQLILVWGLGSAARPDEGTKAKGDHPPELLFKHPGHRQGKVVDFQWSPSDPWTMLSVSDNTGAGPDDRGGGTLQVWRMNDMCYKTDAEVLEELEQHREWIVNGTNPPKPPKAEPTPDAAADVKPEQDVGAGADAGAAAGDAGASAEEKDEAADGATPMETDGAAA